MEIDLKVLRSLVRRGNNGYRNAYTKLLTMAKNEELRREIEEAKKPMQRIMRGLGV